MSDRSHNYLIRCEVKVFRHRSRLCCRHDSLCWVVWAFVLLSQSHDMPSPSPACVEAFSLSHPPLIRRFTERRHVALS